MNDRGQATIELMAIIPLCLVCGWALVECGIVVRDRIAVAQAASSAAVAQLEGRDPVQAARAALPEQIGRDAEVQRDGERLVVRTQTRARLLGAAGAPRLESSVRLPAGEEP